jgi:FkbM family methyltransferase
MIYQYSPEDCSDFFKYIDYFFPNNEDVKNILDIGSLHCLESIEFSKKYQKSKIFAFEPNPKSYNVCLENIKNYSSIEVLNKCVSNFNGITKFYPINEEKTVTNWFDGNRGASSLYKSNGNADHIEKYVQDEIETECITIKSFAEEKNINFIDAVWIDAQGEELNVLKGFESLLKTVKVIHTEIERIPIYENQSLYPEINDYLLDNNFTLVDEKFGGFASSNFIYINKEIN